MSKKLKVAQSILLQLYMVRIHIIERILFYCRATLGVSLLLTARRNLSSLGSFQHSDLDTSVYSQLSPCGHPAIQLATVEPRFNEPLYNEDLDITNHFLYPNNSKIYEK